MRWLFDREAPSAGARLLEVGCGPAAFWEANGDRIDPTWRLTLTDFSPGMIGAARRVLGDRAEFLVADVQQLPFPDGTFDVVLANHMLYHVPDRPKALREIARVLVPGGAFHAATNGRGHMRQLHELVDDWDFAQHTEEFGLETGVAQLEPFFADVRVERHTCDLGVNEVEPVVAYVRSSSRYHGDSEQVRRVVEEAIARDGVFRIEKSQGVLHARKP
jgi:ubiquinone/menaquinone biosynthesis C-methylase UbiE